jgi:ornithine cyclodeaminase/alanine dehydrogenase-like protein (mu-crystallin family)
MSSLLPWLDAADVVRLLPMADAIDALEGALLAGLDPSAGSPRSVIDTRTGQLLLMPSEIEGAVGVKIVTASAGNAGRGLPRIQGVYLLIDADTLAPVALIDGIALTSLRTPAMSAVAVKHLAAPDASRLVVFGCGPQAAGHIEAVRAVRPVTDVVVVGRDPERTARFVAEVAATAEGVRIVAGTPDAVAEADVVVCATTAADSVLDGRLVRDTACVVAVGSHEPHRRELPADLMGRATVVVEDAATALCEAGDVVMAVTEGVLEPADLVTIADLVNGRSTVPAGVPTIFKSVGMAWQDLVTAALIGRRRDDAGS